MRFAPLLFLVACAAPLTSMPPTATSALIAHAASNCQTQTTFIHRTQLHYPFPQIVAPAGELLTVVTLTVRMNRNGIATPSDSRDPDLIVPPHRTKSLTYPYPTQSIEIVAGGGRSRNGTGILVTTTACRVKG